MTTITAPAPTTEYITADVRICPTCKTPMDEVRPDVYVCPISRTEARVISDERRALVQATADARVDGVDF